MRLTEHLQGVALVEASADQAADALTSTLQRFGPTQRSQINGWKEAKKFLLPLRSMATRYAILPVSSWTLLLSNLWLEARHVDALAISTRTGCRAVSGYFTATTRHFHSIEAGREVRSIVCYKDNGKWVFHETGRQQPFEAPALYEERRIQSRLTPEVVCVYLQEVTGIVFPPVWANLVQDGVGIERSTKDVKVQTLTYAVEDDA